MSSPVAAGADRRPSLSARILAGLAAGLATGLFFGHLAAALQPLADVYIRLMQMTVLPYLVLALVIGFGQLDGDVARRLAWRAAAMLAATWGLTGGVIAVLPLALPAAESASFFSHAMVEAHEPLSIPDLFFTANPFHSLSNAVVPAVVLFASTIGVALIGLPGREKALDTLRVLNAAVVRVTLFVVELTPYGVFALSAVAAGTLPGETFARLGAYFAAFAVAALLLAFVALPLLVAAVTPFRYREVVGIAGDALLTAFVANNAFIVLPILVERSKGLLERHGRLDPRSEMAADVLIPILFNFPNAGRLLTLLFVPFGAWLAGSPLGLVDHAHLFALGIPSYFAKAQVALPFLLDVLELPHDLFQLYLPTTIVTGKFDSMVTAMNLLAFALVGAAAAGGFLTLTRTRLAGALAATGVATVAGALLLRATLGLAIDTSYHQDEALRRMHAPRAAADVVVHRTLAAAGRPPAAGAAGLARVRERGRLRIGYDPGNVPFSFVNLDGELVGFDVELSIRLAAALGAHPEFVPITWPEVGRLLDEGVVDVVPGVWYRPYWFEQLRLSQPYLEGTMGIATLDPRRHEFARVEDLRGRRGLRIGVPLDADQVAASLERYFGGVSAVEAVPLPSAGPFFEGREPQLDGFLMPAEAAAAATLLHPRYTVVVPQPDPVRVPFAFGVARDAEGLAEAIDRWLVFVRSEGSLKAPYDYWVLGQGARDPRPRWSILRDVLGWGRRE
jgi:Na+/H+-dicarboxylate symporter